MIDSEPCLLKLRFNPDLQISSPDFLYVESAYNVEANDYLSRCTRRRLFSKRSIKRFGRYYLCYLPAIAKGLLKDKKAVRYANPSRIEPDTNHLYDLFFDSLLSDPSVITSGFIHTTSVCDNNRTYRYYTYTPYVQQQAENLEQLFAEIAERDKVWETAHKVVSNSPNIRYSIKFPDKSADDRFSYESLILIDEISKRIEKLEQHGISRTVLFKMLGNDIKLSRMSIDSRYRIYLIDYESMEIKMTPLVKAVYFLFLNHPEGIPFKNLEAYKDELTKIYSRISRRSDVDDIKRSVDDICNPMCNSINEKCARIREAFISKFDSCIAQHYFVRGERGEPKKIELDRELVIWENRI